MYDVNFYLKNDGAATGSLLASNSGNAFFLLLWTYASKKSSFICKRYDEDELMLFSVFYEIETLHMLWNCQNVIISCNLEIEESNSFSWFLDIKIHTNEMIFLHMFIVKLYLIDFDVSFMYLLWITCLELTLLH